MNTALQIGTWTTGSASFAVGDACFRPQSPVRSFLAGKSVTTTADIKSRELGVEGGTSSDKTLWKRTRAKQLEAMVVAGVLKCF